ncbi:MAG: hypothetical protein ACRC62_20175 [Microcoleus sp.]
MKEDGGCVSVINNNEHNRDLLARRLQRQGAVNLSENRFQVNSILRPDRMGAARQNKHFRHQEHYLLEKQEKSERLLGKENTNG